MSRRWLDRDGAVYRIGRNVLSILLGNAAAEAINYYALVFSAMKLGRTGFGELAAAQAFIDPFATLSAFGLGVVSTTMAARRQGCDGELQGSLSSIYASLALVSSLGALLLAMLFAQPYPPLLLALMAVGPLQHAISAPASLPIAFNQTMHRLMWIPAVGAIVRLAALYAIVAVYNKPVGHQLAATVAMLLGMLLVWRVSKAHYPTRWSVSWSLVKELFVLAWPLATLEVIVMVYSRASYYFLANLGLAAQGEYGAADRLSRPLLSLASAIVASAMPSVARLSVDGKHGELWAYYRKALTRCAQVLIPLAALAVIAVPPILRRYAPEYAGSALPFQVLIVGVCFMFVNQLSSMFIVGLGRFRLIMVVALINLVVYLALAFVFVPRYKVVGAAISTGAMEGVNCLVQLAILTRLLRDNTRSAP